jgi:hypothetical protein
MVASRKRYPALISQPVLSPQAIFDSVSAAFPTPAKLPAEAAYFSCNAAFSKHLREEVEKSEGITYGLDLTAVMILVRIRLVQGASFT